MFIDEYIPHDTSLGKVEHDHGRHEHHYLLGNNDMGKNAVTK
jgi:hypothetical protein